MEDKKDNSIVKLVNPEFDFEFMGNSYRIRKATLDKLISYQNKVKDLEGDAGADSKLIAHCIYIMLKDKIEGLTEQTVLENTPADIDILDILSKLGFISPSKMKTVKGIQDLVQDKLSGETSS